jgi:hypothetical protein
LVDVEVCDFGVLAVKDLGDLFEGWAAGLDVEEVDEDELAEYPDLTEGVRLGCTCDWDEKGRSLTV